jgi:hypothetical protein
VHQLLHFICLSALFHGDSSAESSSSSSSSGFRLVDDFNNAPVTAVSLLELAHALPQQVHTHTHTHTHIHTHTPTLHSPIHTSTHTHA